ncbi:MAG: hypothetical protein WBZ36_28095 [Candidatus Nitrosopolaris sp.]
MSPLEFAGEVILVSASGVLSPGPLFFINIIYGSKQGVTGGIKIAFGQYNYAAAAGPIGEGLFAADFFEFVFCNNRTKYRFGLLN